MVNPYDLKPYDVRLIYSCHQRLTEVGIGIFLVRVRAKVHPGILLQCLQKSKIFVEIVTKEPYIRSPTATLRCFD